MILRMADPLIPMPLAEAEDVLLGPVYGAADASLRRQPAHVAMAIGAMTNAFEFFLSIMRDEGVVFARAIDSYTEVSTGRYRWPPKAE